jgi:hypothetical protein
VRRRRRGLRRGGGGRRRVMIEHCPLCGHVWVGS